MRWPALLLLCALTGCARHYSAEAVAEPYGFLFGLWHGLVCPYALMANLVSWGAGLVDVELMRSIEVVGRPNTGFWYYCGFVFGLGAYGGGAKT